MTGPGALTPALLFLQGHTATHQQSPGCPSRVREASRSIVYIILVSRSWSLTWMLLGLQCPIAGVPAHLKGDFLDCSHPHVPLLFPDPPVPSEWRRRNSCLFPSHASQRPLLLGEEPGNKGEAPRTPALERSRAPARYRALCHWRRDQCLAWCWAGGIRVS